MEYNEYGPCSDLKPYITKFYHLKLEEYHLPLPPVLVASSGMVYINIYFQSLWSAYSQQEYFQPSHITINGQICKRSIYYYAEGATDNIGIEFYPSGCAKLFHVPMIKFTNRMESLDKAINMNTKSLYEGLLRKTDARDRIMVIEKWLLELARTAGKIPLYVRACQEIIEHQDGKLSIDDISDELGYSKRTLEKNFQYFAGLPLKYYAQVKRINHLIKLRKEKPNLDSLDLMYLGDFYDQSHFIKIFKQVTSQTPTQYFGEKNPITEQFIGK